MRKYEKMVDENLTNRYIKIIEENRLWFFNYKQWCKEAALKEKKRLESEIKIEKLKPINWESPK